MASICLVSRHNELARRRSLYRFAGGSIYHSDVHGSAAARTLHHYSTAKSCCF